MCHASHMAPRRRRRGRPRAFDSDAVRIGPKLDTRPPAKSLALTSPAQGDPEWMKNALATKCDDQQAITEVMRTATSGPAPLYGNVAQGDQGQEDSDEEGDQEDDQGDQGEDQERCRAG